MTATTIYLSPHLDDAVLSCGGQIASQVDEGAEPVVLTVFAGNEPARLSPLAMKAHGWFGLERDVVATRKAEDRAACTRLGAEYRHWDIPEAIYRGRAGAWLYRRKRDLFFHPHPRDEELINLIAERFASLSPSAVVAPLGIGGHVDHLIVRRAAEKVWGRQLAYYEDFPYVTRWAPALRWKLERGRLWQRQVIPLSGDQLDRKTAAIAKYASQTDMLFRNVADMERQVRKHAARRGGECVWHWSQPAV